MIKKNLIRYTVFFLSVSSLFLACPGKKPASVELTGDFGIGRSSNTTNMAFGFRNTGTDRLTTLTGRLVIEDTAGGEDILFPFVMSSVKRMTYSEETGRFEPEPFYVDPGETIQKISDRIHVHKNRIIIDFYHPSYWAYPGSDSGMYKFLHSLLSTGRVSELSKKYQEVNNIKGSDGIC
jgi:hypothetical protein